MKIRTRHIACDVEVDFKSLPHIDTQNPYYTDTAWAYKIAREYKDYWIPEPYINLAGGDKEYYSQESVVASGILYEVCRILEGSK